MQHLHAVPVMNHLTPGEQVERRAGDVVWVSYVCATPVHASLCHAHVHLLYVHLLMFSVHSLE